MPWRTYRKEELPEWSEAADSAIAVQLILSAIERRFAGKTMDVLEICGGTSPEALFLLDRLPDWDFRCVNLDVSYSLLRLLSLHLRYKRPDYYSRFSFLCADANACTIGQGIDLILISRALHHFADPVAQLKFCRDRISVNGLIAFVCEPVAAAYDKTTVKLLERGVNEQVFSFNEYLNMFEQAGLSPLECRLDWGFSLKAILEK